jgi:hypothetical protein
MIAMKFTIELDTGLSFLPQTAPPQLGPIARRKLIVVGGPSDRTAIADAALGGPGCLSRAARSSFPGRGPHTDTAAGSEHPGIGLSQERVSPTRLLLSDRDRSRARPVLASRTLPLRREREPSRTRASSNAGVLSRIGRVARLRQERGCGSGNCARGLVGSKARGGTAGQTVGERFRRPSQPYTVLWGQGTRTGAPIPQPA